MPFVLREPVLSPQASAGCWNASAEATLLATQFVQLRFTNGKQGQEALPNTTSPLDPKVEH
jgi:hypothetical protein